MEGSERAAEMGSGSASGNGLDLVACKGLSETLGLAGRVWVFGHGPRSTAEAEFGDSELGVGV